MQPIPDSKANELLERINAYGNAEERNDLTLKAISREIEALQASQPAVAFALKGMVAAEERNPLEVRKYFENARRLNPIDSWIELNYSTALFKLGYLFESRELAKTVYEANPSDLSGLDLLIMLSCNSCGNCLMSFCDN